MSMTSAGPPLRTTIEAPAAGPHVVITAGVHGDEFEPMAAVRRLIQILPGTLLRGGVTLIPVANESAFLRGARTAEDGLDLARTFPGKSDGSVTERAAHAVAEVIRQADYYLDLHTGGAALSLLPLTGYMLHRDPTVLQAQRRMARAFNLPVIWGTDWRLEGRSLSTARDAGVPAIYVEHLGGAACRPEGVAALVEGCLNVLGDLGMLQRDPPPAAVEHFVEDDKPGSGHLQIRHPAPMIGFFEPAVALGQRVAAGEVLGQVCDALANDVRAISAEHAGIVLGLRIFPRVLEGDALAVILETT
jgi:predicted deacylase